MRLAAGTRLGPYEVISVIGAGGMGEVYRARDTRLDRIVALKILPHKLADSAEARQRFEREARAVSSLNHPHICALYDVGQQDNIDFLVMEYLEGETLAARIERGALPLDELIRFAVQIADALDRAHRQGVVHRDLKPGNIMLTKSGTKLLDFGLAKAAGLSPMTNLSSSPTESRPLTADGTLIGTFQYMAPEQLESRPADTRTDIFAFGLVIYEMAAGQRAFDGTTQASLIAAILKDEPRPLDQLAPMTPPALERLVRTCLAKDPAERWRSAHDLKIQLKWIAERATEVLALTSAARRTHTREKIAWGVALLLLVAVLWLGMSGVRSSPQPAVPMRSSLMPPPGSAFLPYQFAISPDGRRLAFVGVGADGRETLWVRALSSSSAQQINGAEEANYPFWAPDSRRIGFFANGKLKIVDSAGGGIHIVCEARNGRGGTWNRSGTIVFAPNFVGPLYRVQDSGGAPVPVTRIRHQESPQAHRWPYFLPDGVHFLYFQDWSSPNDAEGDGIYVASLDSPEPKLISSELTGTAAFASGNLLYVRDRFLIAQPFDSDRLETRGPPVPIGEQEVEKDLAFSKSGFSVSDNGVLVFQSAADSPTRFVWFDAAGKELGQLSEIGYRDPRISPDGRFLAVSADDYRNGKRSIRIYDLKRGVSTRIATSGEFPAWSRDGKQVTYVDVAGNTYSMEQIPFDGSGSAQTLLKGGKMIPNDWTPDGHLVFMSFGKGAAEISIYSASDKRASIQGPGAEAQFSPDGKWLATQGMQGEVIVQPFPGPGGIIQISNAGGAQPRWSRDGRQIFYIAPDRKLMAAAFDPQYKSASAPRALFQTRIVSPSFVLFQYDVGPDGRFLINSFSSNSSAPLTLRIGWTTQHKP
ncbi:MAG TPA: protein kinase [Candidatus Acidoferrales bacterium]|jgi:serine/threonine protein kinase|nr:protein kinase [Candidatus Acidoferrales bacterium]